MGYEGFTDFGYKPSNADLVCLYRVEPARGVAMKRAAEHVAGESSVGTWTDVKTMKPRIKKLAPKIYSIKGRFIKVAYPQELFEPANIPQILSSIGGNVFGMKAVKNLRLEDIDFPFEITRSFKGPAFGVPGIRKIVKTKRPLLGTIVKPKVGLTAKEHARVAFDCWVGGLDLVKDDENLSSLSFNKFEERVTRCLEARDKAEAETGEKKLCLLNCTASTSVFLDRAEYVKKQGGRVAMIDIVTCGWGTLADVRNAGTGLVLHAHRAGHAAFTRNQKHGVSMLVVAKVSRLLGTDTLHIGTVDLGKMEGSAQEVLEIEREIGSRRIQEHGRVLKEEWLGLKPVMAVASGGLYPGVVPGVVKKMGHDIIVQAGGGIHGHPKGSRAGAKAMRQALEASLEGVPLKKAALKNKELALALKKWGAK